jgi:hypothetical protein
MKYLIAGIETEDIDISELEIIADVFANEYLSIVGTSKQDLIDALSSEGIESHEIEGC